MNKRMQKQQGFTLIELSIVLVIVGLIIGGVFVGQTMIKAAELHATVSQVEKYNAAVNTFRLKFSALPGDMNPADAGSFGLLQLNSAPGLRGNGDNNGVIEDGNANVSNCGGGVNGGTFSAEIMTFWRHLSDANLVDGQFGTAGNSLVWAAKCTLTGPVTNVTQSMPPTKIGHSVMVTVMSGGGINAFALLPITAIAGNGVYTIGTTGLTPTESQNIDAKIDDGKPETGKVVAIGVVAPGPGGGAKPSTLIGAGSAPSASLSSTSNTCVIGDGISASDTYNLVPGTGGNDPSCGLGIRF